MKHSLATLESTLQANGVEKDECSASCSLLVVQFMPLRGGHSLSCQPAGHLLVFSRFPLSVLSAVSAYPHIRISISCRLLSIRYLIAIENQNSIQVYSEVADP